MCDSTSTMSDITWVKRASVSEKSVESRWIVLMSSRIYSFLSWKQTGTGYQWKNVYFSSCSISYFCCFAHRFWVSLCCYVSVSCIIEEAKITDFSKETVSHWTKCYILRYLQSSLDLVWAEGPRALQTRLLHRNLSLSFSQSLFSFFLIVFPLKCQYEGSAEGVLIECLTAVQC